MTKQKTLFANGKESFKTKTDNGESSPQLSAERCSILCMLGNFVCFFVVCGFFLKLTSSKQSLGNTIRMSNSLDPDQTRHFVGSDLGPNCLQGKGHQQMTLTVKELII